MPIRCAARAWPSSATAWSARCPRGWSPCPRRSKDLLAAGALVADPQTYEDFLPVSAAGIFQSNLGTDAQSNFDETASQDAFEAALGCAVTPEMELYRAVEEESLARSLAALAEGGDRLRAGRVQGPQAGAVADRSRSGGRAGRGARHQPLGLFRVQPGQAQHPRRRRGDGDRGHLVPRDRQGEADDGMGAEFPGKIGVARGQPPGGLGLGPAGRW